MNRNTLYRAYYSVPLAYRRKGFWITALMVLNAILDFFSIASFFPLIFFILEPNFISNNETASMLYEYFGFPSVASFIIAITVVVLCFLLIKNFVGVWIARAKINFAFKIGKSLSLRAMSEYMKISFLDFSQADFTRELNKITNYPFFFANNILLPITTLISELFICLLFLSGMAYYDFKMLLLLLILITPALVIYQMRKKTLKKISQDLKVKYPALLKSALQIVEGYPEIKTYRKESFFKHNFQRLNNELTETFIKDQALQAGTIRLTEIIVGIIICSLIIYTVYAYQNYQQTLLLLSLYGGASFRMIPSANRILHVTQQLRMHGYLLDELGDKRNIEYTSEESPCSPCTFDKTIEFKNISFQYPNGPASLKNISFTIQKGEKVGIIGNSGEGKTSLLLVLLRFLKETSGEILVDGKLIANENGWRRIIGYVPQSPYILDATICENLAFGIPASEIDRSKVLRIISDLGLQDLVQQLPNGIDSRIGERGAKLSGGQKQRLAIGRALYADVEIFLFDEITNQVHSSLEAEILDLLIEIANRRKTIIMVTHKVSTGFFDTIYHLEKSKLKKVSVAAFK